MADDLVGGNAVVTWLGSPSLKLQRSTALNPGVWTDVAGTLGAGTATVPVSGSGTFFRLSQ